MRYPASEKLEITRLVEQSHLGVTRRRGRPHHLDNGICTFMRLT